jgi:hypothetical protein
LIYFFILFCILSPAEGVVLAFLFILGSGKENMVRLATQEAMAKMQ